MGKRVCKVTVQLKNGHNMLLLKRWKIPQHMHCILECTVFWNVLVLKCFLFACPGVETQYQGYKAEQKQYTGLCMGKAFCKNSGAVVIMDRILKDNTYP